MISCKTCDTGELRQQSKYRLSRAVVTIGYILLVPSVLGLLFAALVLVMAVSVDRSAGLLVILLGPLLIGVPSLVGGLLGWLLVMKKDVLQCGNCGAVTPAS